MRTIVIDVVGTIFVLAVSAAASYGLAILGEPRSLWFWRDILGLMQ